MSIKGRGGSALQGAATGAAIGTAFSPLGTAIGAGVGALGGALLYGGESDYDAYTDEQLAELKRRQELGLLGLSSEDEALIRGRLRGGLNAARREQQENLRMAAVGQDPGGFMKQAAAAEGEVARQSVEAELAIAQADLQAAAEEEQKIIELLAVQHDIDFQQSQAAWSSASAAAQGITLATMQAGEDSVEYEKLMSSLAALFGVDNAEDAAEVIDNIDFRITPEGQ